MFLQNNNTAYLMYNDGVPNSVNYSRKYGHTKGMTKTQFLCPTGNQHFLKHCILNILIFHIKKIAFVF